MTLSMHNANAYLEKETVGRESLQNAWNHQFRIFRIAGHIVDICNEDLINVSSITR